MASGDTDNTITTASADYKEAAPSPDAHKQPGRPSKRTPENVEKLMRGLRLGMSRTRCAQLIGITYETLKEWCRDDDFSAMCHEAEAEGVLLHADNVRRLAHEPDANSTCFNASRFYLATHDRESFAEKSSIELSGNVNVTATLAALFAADAGEVPLDGDAG